MGSRGEGSEAPGGPRGPGPGTHALAHPSHSDTLRAAKPRSRVSSAAPRFSTTWVKSGGVETGAHVIHGRSSGPPFKRPAAPGPGGHRGRPTFSASPLHHAAAGSRSRRPGALSPPAAAPTAAKQPRRRSRERCDGFCPWQSGVRSRPSRRRQQRQRGKSELPPHTSRSHLGRRTRRLPLPGALTATLAGAQSRCYINPTRCQRRHL